MVSLATPSPLDRILSEHVKNLSNLILGASGYGQRVQFTQYSDSTNYANTFGNTDTTNGRAVKVQYGDPSGSPVTLATFQKSGSRIQSNDGTDYIDVSTSGVAVTGTFTVNGSSIGGGMAVYNVLDHGIVKDSSTAATYAAANSTALESLWTTVATAGGGIIYFPPGLYPFDSGTDLNHALGYSATVSLLGTGGSTWLRFHGTTGPFLTIGSTATSAVNYGFIRDFYVEHMGAVTSGATFRLGYCSNYLIENIRLLYNTASKAAINPVALYLACSGLKFVNCKFSTRADEATLTSGGLFPIGIDMAMSSASAGFEFHNTEISGCANRSTGIRFVNTAAIDTIWFNDVLIKDHETGMRFGIGNDNGGVTNLIANGLVIDGIDGTAVQASPGGTASVGNLQFNGCWFGGPTSGSDYNFLLDNTNAGTLSGIQVNGSYLTSALTRSVYVIGAVSEVVLTGNRITFDGNAAGKVAVDIGDGSASVSDVAITGNRIGVGGSSNDAVLRINANVDSFAVTGNVLRGGADTDGIVNTPGAGASRVVANNSFL